MENEMVESKPLTAQLPAAERSMVEVEVARAVAQIQGSMTIAKKFPRDENLALNRIKQASARRRLAEQAEYEYSRGGSKIVGPSIRAAETVAQAWGNIDMGVIELNRDSSKGESLAMAYAVDLETNTWKHVTFSVPHVRDTKQGSKRLTESRDVYETVMNSGSRRLRNCILAVIPGDVMDEFIEGCNKTLSQDSIPLTKRIDDMFKAMKELEVTQAMIEQKMQCKLAAITERQLAQLRRIYQSIKDGFGGVSDYFPVPTGDVGTAAKDLNARQKVAGGPTIKPQSQTPQANSESTGSSFQDFYGSTVDG